ncbi:4795_t:CDS:2, partial [Scutellospora calospora]
IKAYRTGIPSNNMNTTNMLESWHKHLNMEVDIWQQQWLADIRAEQMMLAERETHSRQIKGQELANTQQQHIQQASYQQQPTTEMLIESIQKITHNLHDLDINAL